MNSNFIWNVIITADIGEFTSYEKLFEEIAKSLNCEINDKIRYNKDNLGISPQLYEEIKKYADENLGINAKLFMMQCPNVEDYCLNLKRNDFCVYSNFITYEDK